MSTPRASDQVEMKAYCEYGGDDTPVGAVVTAVAEATGQSPLELDPLGKVVDTDALNALFGSHRERPPSVTVTFEYGGHRVTVTTDSVRVAP